MRLRGVTVAASACLLVAGCTGSSEAPATERGDTEPAVAGLSDWQPPAGAPEFCTTLAATEHVEQIPDAVGVLLDDPADTQQAWRLSRSAGELRDVRDAVRAEGGHGELAGALDELVQALSLAASGPLDEESTDRIADGLSDVGRAAQPICEFPT
ncbi:hypothetical protein [Blastococcus sp. PRF04-17]|uniref:hypothetical protein n=1 Tax=Blastococcus sp. PRF04-17 TaxID=2933797 RepID=UPI001FF4E4A3|nr:hypothetical protein [Blastococcus sp. PRF04-17]UOY00202.1 hypothetical protein MVA48_14450 [Blastococcus sp. PRF04-17]